MQAARPTLQVEGPEGDVLRGKEEFALEGALRRAAVERFFGRNSSRMRIVVFLGKMGEDKIARARVKALWVAKKFADGVIRKMARAAENALLDDPGIGADLEHVEIVIGFEDQAIGVAEMDFDELRHVAEVGDDGELGAVGAEGEGDGVGGIMRNGEGVDVDVANSEALAGLNGFKAVEAFAERVRKNLIHRVHSGLGNIERSLPESEHLWQTVAVVGVLVGDEDAVELVDGLFDGGEAGQGFAFAESGVNKEAGALGLEQGDVARAAGRQNGYAQADRLPPENRRAEARHLHKQIFRMMAEWCLAVNGGNGRAKRAQ